MTHEVTPSKQERTAMTDKEPHADMVEAVFHVPLTVNR